MLTSWNPVGPEALWKVDYQDQLGNGMETGYEAALV